MQRVTVAASVEWPLATDLEKDAAMRLTRIQHTRSVEWAMISGMDTLVVAPEEMVVVTRRSNKEIRVTYHMYDALRVLRHELKQVARTGGTITYQEASNLTDGAYLPQGWGPALDVLSEDCARRGEPSLAALVVRKDEGEVGEGFLGDAAAERKACYRYDWP